MKPIIGITPSPTDDPMSEGGVRYAIASTYTEAIEAAGGIPVVLPPQASSAGDIIPLLDGLLLSGGGDVRPDRYGDQTVHPLTYGIHDLRDEFEIDLVRTAIERDLPVLCICRGIQVLNVALGGSLIQDIPDQYETDIIHSQRVINIPRNQPCHLVSAELDSLLHQVYDNPRIATNSFHHQAIKDVSPELRVLAYAEDGIVEAVDRPGSTWLLGVQWHPEMMFRSHPEHLRPFQALIRAALQRREQPTLSGAKAE